MNRTRFDSLLAALVLACASASAFAATAAAQGEQQEPVRYVQVTAAKATARNLADPRGLSVGDFEKGTPLAVYREQAGFLAVEAPGGFHAWVLGRFLRKTNEPGVWEVTGNGVNIRPGPKDDVLNFPLGKRLFAGDRVRVVGKNDPKLADADAWFHILTPPGVTAWISASDVGAFGAGSDPVALWRSAVAQAAPVVPATPPAKDPRAEVVDEPVMDDARSVLEKARTLLETEKNKNVPDYGKVRTELQRAKRLAGEGVVAVEAQAELERVDALEDVAELRDRLETERQRVVSETAEAQAEAWNRARRKDPLGTLFHARGILERRLETDGTPRYVLVSGGSTTHELTCTSGRYDLDLFLGFQVGVRGPERTLLGTRILTVDALEVVSAR